MAATHTAADEAAQYTLEAEQAQFVIETAWRMHRQYVAAADSETRLALMLGPLEQQGFRILNDRLWPGSARGHVDFVLLGPTGVVIVDAKSWLDVTIDGERVYQSQQGIHGHHDVTDRFANLANLAEVTQHHLAEIGIAPGEVRVVAVLMGERNLTARIAGVDLVGEDQAIDYLLKRGSRLRPAQVESVITAAERLFQPYPDRERPIELAAPGDLIITIDDIEAALESSILTPPIEDWMTFLSPEQARLACRSFSGPALIRGAAGTGKTVVGLHRAAQLSRTRRGTVLVTTLVPTLPGVLSTLLARMAPDAVDNVEFTGIHSFAERMLRDRGARVSFSAKAANAAFDRAWFAVGRGGILGSIDPVRDYWHEEVVNVIKGRGITHFPQYAELQRVGRRRPLTHEARRGVWELFTEYDLQLREAGVHDAADVILLAERSLRGMPLRGYSAVIADEAQDLTCAMIRFLHLLAGNGPDGLTLIGDGQQTIYAGGYTLAEAGVSVHGRSVGLTRNFRNTVELSTFANSLVAGDEYEDIEGKHTPRDATTDATRHGARPRLSRFATIAGQERAILGQLQTLMDAGVSGGDIAILTHTDHVANEVMLALSMAGIPTEDLHDYDGTVSNAVKVGTIKRAKGLEFRQVLVVRATSRFLSSSHVDLESEERALERRELYVAMTRARDGVWVGVG
jgi:hypothetical protein